MPEPVLCRWTFDLFLGLHFLHTGSFEQQRAALPAGPRTRSAAASPASPPPTSPPLASLKAAALPAASPPAASPSPRRRDGAPGNLLHRDVKLENVFVFTDARRSPGLHPWPAVKLGDFGISKVKPSGLGRGHDGEGRGPLFWDLKEGRVPFFWGRGGPFV